VGVVEARLVDEDGLALGLAPQVVLGERGSLVRPVRLGADEDDPAVEALLPQGGGRLGPREARADDDVGVVVGHVALSFDR
jgi:hypothetical protein